MICKEKTRHEIILVHDNPCDMQDEQKRLSERKCHVPPPHQIEDQHHLTWCSYIRLQHTMYFYSNLSRHIKNILFQHGSMQVQGWCKNDSSNKVSEVEGETSQSRG